MSNQEFITVLIDTSTFAGKQFANTILTSFKTNTSFIVAVSTHNEFERIEAIEKAIEEIEDSHDFRSCVHKLLSSQEDFDTIVNKFVNDPYD